MEHISQISELDKKRHSLAHLLGAALVDLYPGSSLAIGPYTDTGFYYDIDASSTISEVDLPHIHARMCEIYPLWDTFEKRIVSADEARALFADNLYKLELINEIAEKGEEITLYTSGGFTDLCRGGHVAHMSEIAIDAFHLERVAGAYWRGSEKNKMLTRVYGFAFDTKAELDAYLYQQEEAKKRDHRVLGKKLGLFTFTQNVGSGLPIWLPKGATVRRVLERFIVDTELDWGYLHVNTPDIAKLDLYKKSGHYPYYKESMYAPMAIDEEEFMLRPMTCPHHFELFSDTPKSYRDLPMRIAELAKLYRYEASGELSGLVRVRSFCLADAHIICADPLQAQDEVSKALDLIEHVSSIFGLEKGKDYSYRLSLGDKSDEGKYYKNDEAWEIGEALLREVLQKRNFPFHEAEGEAAFYGPKIDIQMKDVKGKENTAFTVQYDFCMPDRFNLEYTAQDGTKKRPLVVHRSSIGAIERVMAFLIEHYAGAFPLWLAPVQAGILPVREELHGEKALEIQKILQKADIRAEVWTDDGFGKRVRRAKDELLPYYIILGDKDIEAGMVTVEVRGIDGGTQMKIEDLVEKLKSEIETKKI